MRRMLSLVVLSLVTLTAVAFADESATYQSLWQEANAKPDCKPSEYDDFILVTCDSEFTLWYFTKPNHLAHPGVIKRTLSRQKSGDWAAREEGYSFSSDDRQAAFKAWLAQIRELDRQMSRATQP